ncbi:MAG: Flp pilus assembly complex ATPase component [Planctomycetes bacterium]|nr:Flp pilus assembly complex ATPase component [Planctomycetota bacterium]
MTTTYDDQSSGCYRTGTIGPYADTLNTFLLNAIMDRVTDVHLHSAHNGIRVLYRVDGIVHPKVVLPRDKGRKLLNQIKAAANLDAVRTFSPLEGQIHWRHGEFKLDIRVTLTPIQENESIHLRMLRLPADGWNVEKLGLSKKDRRAVSNTIHTQSGLVLISGGTGSGKTTTMYSLASLLDLNTTTTYSIEDPVEYTLPYAQQIEVDERHGLTMHEGLRTILRMDPDLIMVGEIRDKDSAIVAARAALSGKLVLATIHAHDAAGAIDSLHYLGVPMQIIGSALRLVIAQNLVRKLCDCCDELVDPSDETSQLFDRFGISVPETLKQAGACTECNGYGFYERTGLFEVLPIDEKIKTMISNGVHHQDLSQYLRSQGVTSIIQDGLNKVAQGITSMDELHRACKFNPSSILETSPGPTLT